VTLPSAPSVASDDAGLDVTPTASSPTADSVPEDTFTPRFSSLLETLSNLTAELREVSLKVKAIQKEHAKFVRETKKKTAKRARSVKPRGLTGFAKPTLLSDEMYNFLGVEKGTMVVRHEVTKSIIKYIKDNNLRKEDGDRRQIIPDATLKALTRVTDENVGDLTYFKLQKYINHHFVKPSPAAVVASS